MKKNVSHLKKKFIAISKKFFSASIKLFRHKESILIIDVHIYYIELFSYWNFQSR